MRMLLILTAYLLWVSFSYLQESYRLSDKYQCQTALIAAKAYDLVPCEQRHGPTAIQKPLLVPEFAHRWAVGSLADSPNQPENSL
jgi:hypothetical protein